ncbi:hypothetical protein IU431_06755 [Nocardia otitidiscaviarum]|uniref:hypothetical protein n=1 Tax=Nocardia otitidiscaviarum TaxID=1823 RepID=UPI0004A7032E|nr:hypothetical protein [Nocardia otitidiscaviarum]MBF6483857.1 hypothetical protein [Nocardia otitidiscaviarum]
MTSESRGLATDLSAVALPMLAMACLVLGGGMVDSKFTAAAVCFMAAAGLGLRHQDSTDGA